MKTHDRIAFLTGHTALLCLPIESDLPLFTRWINDPEINRFLKHRMPILHAGEKKWFDSLADRKNDVVLTLCTTAGRPIGVMGMHRIDWINGTATTGAFIGEKSLWGKGYGSDAKMVLLNYAFNTLNLRKICSRVYDFNGRSLAYSKKCGYREEGRLRKHVFRDGNYYDVIELAVFKEDWLPFWKKYQRPVG
ncbi:MAG TPA: GNAT family protein [Candidatus Paceibacterota bacterium]|nr:GNAT family protein [Candidatus Paceibacterota bacterium]